MYVTVYRKTDIFMQKLKFKLLLVIDTFIFAEYIESREAVIACTITWL